MTQRFSESCVSNFAHVVVDEFNFEYPHIEQITKILCGL
jgi:hypothetical protein